MISKHAVIVTTGGLLIGTLAFFSGRVVETRILTFRDRAREQQASLPAASAAPAHPSFHELQAVEILALPFAEFYEALRSAPTEARSKWAADIEAMPAGPRRTAALAAFYKLVVQFDPLWAANTACEITDKETQDLALDSVTGAAPGFALKDIATLFLKLPADPSDYRKYLQEVIAEWVSIDPPAVAQFYDEHPEMAEHGLNRDLITSWAAIDPRTAKEWLDAHMYAGDEITDFIIGWYLNNRRAATDYAIEHAEELAPTAGLGNLLSALYSDSKEDAKKFIEQLPNDELRNKAFRGLKVNFGTAEETGEPDLTPRAVADWMTQFPPAYWREHLSGVLGYWNDAASQEIFSWIEQQPAAIRGAVAAEYKKPTGKDTVEIVSAVIQFAHPDLRDELFAAMFKNSVGSTGQMVEEIKNSSLSAEQKRHVLEIAEKVDRNEKAAQEESARAENDQGSER